MRILKEASGIVRLTFVIGRKGRSKGNNKPVIGSVMTTWCTNTGSPHKGVSVSKALKKCDATRKAGNLARRIRRCICECVRNKDNWNPGTKADGTWSIMEAYFTKYIRRNIYHHIYIYTYIYHHMHFI